MEQQNSSVVTKALKSIILVIPVINIMTHDSYNSKTDIPHRYRSVAGLVSYGGNQPAKSAYVSFTVKSLIEDRTKSPNLNGFRLVFQ